MLIYPIFYNVSKISGFPKIQHFLSNTNIYNSEQLKNCFKVSNKKCPKVTPRGNSSLWGMGFFYSAKHVIIPGNKKGKCNYSP